MRKLVVLVALFGLTSIASSVAGCGVAHSSEELRNDMAQSVDMDLRQIVNDWNKIWLVDRQYRLTKWHLR